MAQPVTPKPHTSVPTYAQLMFPLLLVAADRQAHRVREISGTVAKHFALPGNLTQETLPDGRNKLIHRLEWARTYLKKAGLLEYPARGFFKITEQGLKALEESPKGIDNKYLEKFPGFLEFKHRKAELTNVTVPNEAQALDPEEAIENSYQALRAEIESDLLNRAKQGAPEFSSD